MPRSIRLRPWQKAALERLASSDGPDFLAVATPGAGKTTFALTAARHDLAAHPGRRLVVVAPTQHLKNQWAQAALAFDLHLDPSWSASSGRLPSDLHGIVTTYQQVASSGSAIAAIARDGFVVLDEVHHAADERAWGEGLRIAFEGAARRLSMSGTPFRSDTRAIPFVHYELEEARPHFEYGYGDALADGRVVRPVYFPRTDGHMEWSAPDGSLHSHTFDDPLDQVRAGQRLRTALSLEGEWLPAVLRKANDQLTAIRRNHPDAGGLVVAIDQDHARGIAALLSDRFGVHATVATSDDPTASDRIARFAAGTSPWIVAVRMVSEGVDIPRLRVGVFATNATTDLFFRQAVGRLVRWTASAGKQPSFMFIPDDVRLRARAFQIADQRRHSLRHDERQHRELLEPEPAALDAATDAQLSLFAPISAVAIEDTELPPWDLDGGGWSPEPADGEDDDSLVLDLPPMPAPPGARPGQGPPPESRKDLREANAERARDIARTTGMPHAQVNAELNRLAGVRRVTEATAQQLEVRLRHATTWLERI